MDQRFETVCKVSEVDASRGLVFGYAIVCKEDGKDYFDLQDEHIPEDVMLDLATDFMRNSREAREMHGKEAIGSVLYALPMTTELAKSLGIQVKRTGLIIGMAPNAAAMKKFVDGDYTGFSIGGVATYEDAV